MTDNLSRRGFVRSGVLATVASASGSVAWSREFFSSIEGGEYLRTLVLKTLALKPCCAPVVDRFIRALQVGEMEQTECTEFVRGLIETAPRGHDALGRYVVGEFVARTNYYEYSLGLEADLKMFGSEETIASV